MRFHISYTTLINPPTANPTLTRPQVWTGLQRKIRHAEEFVPVITSCKVLLDAEDGVVTRQVKFDDGGTPAQVMELVRSYWPSWIDFERENGTHIRNIVSDGPGYELSQLHMTYTFEYLRPELEEGTEAAEQECARLTKMARIAVESTIDTIREMAKDGRITVNGKMTV